MKKIATFELYDVQIVNSNVEQNDSDKGNEFRLNMSLVTVNKT
mgnify:CR=1 FL=1